MSLVEQRSSLRKRLRSERLALLRVSAIVAHDRPLTKLIPHPPDREHDPPPDSEEAAWLALHDVASGFFDDSTIPYPSIDAPHKPSKPSTPFSARTPDVTGSDAPVHDDSVADTIEPFSTDDPATHSVASAGTHDHDEDTDVPITYSQKASEEADGPVAPPGLVAPPQPEDEADFSPETQKLLDLESPPRAAKVVHLPPEGAPEEQRRESEEDRRRRSEDEDKSKHSRTHLHPQTDPASSPSSTVGAYSAATPLAPQDSPDTSPDSESAEQIEVLPPQDMRPSAEEQREKEQHDRILAAQKDLARRQALGDVSTADEQLRWEERAAAARDEEERAAREDVNGPEADAKDEREETMAEEVVDGVEQDREEEERESSVRNEDSKGVTQSSPTDQRVEPPDAQEDGDNITVTPRNKLPLSIDTSRARQQPVEPAVQHTPGEQERMTTRTSSGTLQRRSVSELLGQTPSRRDLMMSPEATSPLTARHHQDTTIAGPSSASPHFPRRAAPSLTTHRHPSTSQSVLDDLHVLKGAADDPDRDYLEPLFRIQAHDSPNIRSSSLPELLRTATKTMSTEDQFSTLHERLDYRILRRIYQLQNANKWSLRQMDKCKEPEQPVSHLDHMMAEMQWMRKDFKAERRMKKSVCAWLARRCADWVAAEGEERRKMQVQVRAAPTQSQALEVEERVPDLDMSGDSPLENDADPPTPRQAATLPLRLIVPPELADTVSSLQKSGRLRKALEDLPVDEFSDFANRPPQRSYLTPVSKFVGGKVLPKSHGPPRKRSRFEYDDEAEMAEDQRNVKRIREERDLPPEDEEIALFHPENKAVRNRLHQNNAFRPPSEFVMPATQFYEFRNGSQWLADDDKKLRDLAKDYSFNWSLIADELQLPGVFKTSAERRTPWECFERWVELEQLPTEMKKTMYFKTWFQRLEQSQQASERRYQAQVAALQAASNGQATHVPMRRRTVPTRVDKRKNTRYIWLIDAMRKLARKKEQKAYKEAESHRAAAQRKTQSENNQPRAPMLTPQEFSKKRHERDLQVQEAQRQHRQKMIEAQQRQIMASRQAAQQAQQQQQQGMQAGGAAANQQRPGSSSNVAAVQQAQMQPSAQQQAHMNGQMSQQARQSMPVSQRNGHLAVPQVNAQGIPQAQMRPSGQMPGPQDSMQRMAHAYAQARNAQYAPGGPGGPGGGYQMPSANMMSPGSGGMSTQQLQQSSQAMLASMQQMTNAQQQQQQQGNNSGHQMSASPNMPPPPTPQNNPQQLSSGHIPAVLNIKAQIRNKFPTYTEDQINQMATEVLKNQSQSSTQARQSAMNAAAGIPNMQAYAHNQQAAAAAAAAAFQQNHQMPNGANFMNGDLVAGGGQGQQQQAGLSPASPQQYAALMRQRQMAQMRQSPNATHANLNGGSPGLAHASPNMQPLSPSLQYAGMNQMAAAMNMNMNGGVGGMGGGGNAQQRPPSRGNTPQMQRLGSSGNGMAVGGGMPSPQQQQQGQGQGMQGSPRGVQASVARLCGVVVRGGCGD